VRNLKEAIAKPADEKISQAWRPFEMTFFISVIRNPQFGGCN
jgi:hypothetical protein